MTAHSRWLDIIYTIGIMSLPLPTDDRDIHCLTLLALLPVWHCINRSTFSACYHILYCYRLLSVRRKGASGTPHCIGHAPQAEKIFQPCTFIPINFVTCALYPAYYSDYDQVVK